MKSRNITGPDAQLTLSFEQGISEKHQSLRECIATGIYQRGIGNCAIDLDESPGNLGVQLSGARDSAGRMRYFSVDALEKYIAKTGDTAPIFYLIDKFLHDKTKQQDAALAQLAPLMPQMVTLMKQAGLM